LKALISLVSFGLVLTPSGLLSVAPFERKNLEKFLRSISSGGGTKSPSKSSQGLSQKLGVLGFFEPSTRTKLSFEAAGRQLGISWLDLRPEDLSLQKGESLEDTFKNIALYGVNFFVIRHSASYFPHWVHRWTQLPVLNAGDGTNEHPTQALGDALTLYQLAKGKKLEICFLGDACRSRVAKSSIRVLKNLGHRISIVDESRGENRAFAKAFEISLAPRKKLSSFDIVYCLRLQKERGAQAAEEPLSLSELGKTSKLMDAGPVIWGETMQREIQNLAPERNLILKQAENAFLVRLALLQELQK